jgi:hypothetical protein
MSERIVTRTLSDSIATLLPGVRVVESRAQQQRAQVYSRTGADGVTRHVYPRHYIPHTAQRTKLHPAAKTRYLVLCSGRRGGKTEGGAAQFWWWIERDAAHKTLGIGRWQGDPHPPYDPGDGKNPEPFLLYFVIAPTNALLAEPKKRLQRMLGMAKNKRNPGLIEVQKRDEEGIFHWRIKGGIRINWLSGVLPDMQVGSGYAGGWCEEAARLKSTVWEANLRPSLSDLVGWCMFTTTPRKRNWFWREVWAKGNRENAELVARLEGRKVEEILDPEFTCVSWTTAENDALPGLAAEMETARRQMSPAAFRENYLADFMTVVGQCFEIEPRVLAPYVRGKRPHRCYVGFDKGNVGQTSHRSAICILTQPERGGVWHEAHTDSSNELLPYGDDSWRARDRGDTSTWATRLYHALRAVAGDEWPGVPVFVPPDAPDVLREWERYGFSVETAYTRDAAQASLTWFQALLKNDRLRLSSEVLFTCMSGLHYPEPGKHSRKPWVDVEDDEYDALRYAASTILQDGTMPTLAPLQSMNWRSL